MRPNAKARAKEMLPTQPVLEELAFLRRNFRDIITHYTAGIESEIAQLMALVNQLREETSPRPDHARDLRDILMLLRDLDVKTSKGRRRDLKRIETLVEEMRTIAERW